MTYCGQRIRVNVLLRVWRDADRLIAQTYESIFKKGLAEGVFTIVHSGGVQPGETTVASTGVEILMFEKRQPLPSREEERKTSALHWFLSHNGFEDNPRIGISSQSCANYGSYSSLLDVYVQSTAEGHLRTNYTFVYSITGRAEELANSYREHTTLTVNSKYTFSWHLKYKI